MRTRNDRSPNSLQEGRNFDNCFLVEEVNRQIGWSIWRDRSPQSPEIGVDRLHDDSKLVTGNASNHKDEKKGESHSIQKNSNQVSKVENGKKADAGNKSNMPTNDQEDGSSCDVTFDSTIALTSSYSSPEKDLPAKKRKGHYRLVTETACMEDGDAKMERADSENMHDKEDLLENGSVLVHEIIGEMVPENIVVEPKERWRSGRNRKSQYPTYAVSHLIKFKFIEEKQRPNRQLANQNNRRENMQMPKGGEAKQVEDKEAKTSRSWEEMANDLSNPTIVLGLPATSGRSDQNRKRGRPRKAT